MNNTFATRFLLQEYDELDVLKDHLQSIGANEDIILLMVNAVAKGHLTPGKAIEIVKSTMDPDNRAVNMAEMSSTGGGVTNGAAFQAGAGEQYASPGAFLKKKKKYQEDAPRLAGGKPADIKTYTQDGFTKAPSAKEAGKHIKGVEVKELWEESRQYSQFKKETATRNKPDQMHEAAKMIQNKLHEIEKLLEFTSQMRGELSEGEQTLEYKHNTKKVFDKIHSKVVEVYTKVKGLK